MKKLDVQYHNFEEAKNNIKIFSEETSTDLNLKKVDDNKDLGEWFEEFFLGGGIGIEHKVTGEELNKLTVQIQSHLTNINNTQISIIQEFGQVYKALESLDKDYIEDIVVSIKTTEETSKRIESTQCQIKQIVDGQKRTLEVLRNFKKKLDTYDHLYDIDEMWKDYQSWSKKLSDLSDKIENVILNVKLNSHKIDNIDGFFINLRNKVTALNNDLEQQNQQLKQVVDFKETLENLDHIRDIDNIWSICTNNSIQINELKKQNEMNNSLLSNALKEIEEKNNEAMHSISTKLKYAYIMISGSLGLALIELIIILLKVM